MFGSMNKNDEWTNKQMGWTTLLPSYFKLPILLTGISGFDQKNRTNDVWSQTVTHENKWGHTSVYTEVGQSTEKFMEEPQQKL